MRLFIISLSLACVLSGCTTLQRAAHTYSDEAPRAFHFEYQDGGRSTYYSFGIGELSQPDTVMFFYGGSGCASWKTVMPGYVKGFAVNARIFALNKRHVTDRSIGFLACGRDFLIANNPDQWVADYSEFIAAQIGNLSPKPRNVVLVGASEGALPAGQVAMGEKDESVPVESARFLEAKFKEAGKDNLVLCIYPGADHRLNAQGVSYRDRFFHELGLLLQHSER